MKHSSHVSKTWPHLVVERPDPLSQLWIGYLHLSSTSPKLHIGAADSREFRLVQCLFSPQNSLSAKYAPVTQTYERIFSAISMSKDAYNARLQVMASAEGEMRGIIESCVRMLQKQPVAQYLSFIFDGTRLRMDVATGVVSSLLSSGARRGVSA